MDNIQSVIKKKGVETILENLIKEDKIIRKDYNQKIYLVNQNIFPKISEKDMQEIEKKIANTNEIQTKTVEKLIKLQNEFKNLGKNLSNEELDSHIELKIKKLQDLNLILRKYEESGIEIIPEEKMKEAEKIYENNLLKYKKIKKVVIEIIDSLAENIGTDNKNFMDSLGFEMEDDYFQKLRKKIK